MRFPNRHLIPAVVAALLLTSSPGCKNNSNSQPDAAVGAAVDSAPPTEAPITKKNVGEACTTDGECVTNICYADLCRKICAGPSDCQATEDCGADSSKHPAFCYTRSYSSEIGNSCALTGSCPEGLKCLNGGADAANAYCGAECKDDTSCPPQFRCREINDSTAPSGKRSYCVRRSFCSRCQHDGQCASGGKCLKQGNESFCTVPCHQGTTECPRVADCKDIGAGEFQCLHRFGSCVGEGKMCDPCTDDPDCQSGALCLTFTFSREAFCATSCPTAGEQCEGSSSYKCEEITLTSSTTSNQCVPTNADTTKPVYCRTLTPTMEVGDTMSDFAMVGYVDENADNSLSDELQNQQLKVTRLSDFSSATIILFNISAGWCKPCNQETSGLADLMSKYSGNGLMIFQVIEDGFKEGDRPTKAILDKWVSGSYNAGTSTAPNMVARNPQGACGMDPNHESAPINTTNGTPLNMILDAGNRKVLAKWSGGAPRNFDSLEAALRHYLGLDP